MVQSISKELSAWLEEVKQQARFRGHLADLFRDFGKGEDKPIDRELNAISEALNVSKFMAIVILLSEGYTIQGVTQKVKYYEVETDDEKLYHVPNAGLTWLPKIIGNTAGYNSKITQEEMEKLDEYDKQFAKQI